MLCSKILLLRCLNVNLFSTSRYIYIKKKRKEKRPEIKSSKDNEDSLKRNLTE